jgi:cobalt-zinc-cadmium efflux system outer membrane protein
LPILDRDIRIAHAELRAAEDRAVLARDNVGQRRSWRALRLCWSMPDAIRRSASFARRPAGRSQRAEQARTFSELLTARRLLGRPDRQRAIPN